VTKGDDIQERLIDFAVAIIGLASKLPNTSSGKHVAGQILRSGTSPAPNYGEARGAESRRDFVHELKIALKELNETEVWLIIIQRSNLLPDHKVESAPSECSELCKIIGSSVKTASDSKE